MSENKKNIMLEPNVFARAYFGGRLNVERLDDEVSHNERERIDNVLETTREVLHSRYCAGPFQYE